MAGCRSTSSQDQWLQYIPNPTFQAQISFARSERQLFVFQRLLRVAAPNFRQ